MPSSTVITERLAELVADLSGCPAGVAHDAVRQAADNGGSEGDERLELVARALVAVRRQVAAGAVVAGGGSSSSPTSSTTPPPSASSADA